MELLNMAEPSLVFCPREDSQSQSGLCDDTCRAHWSPAWAGILLLEQKHSYMRAL